MKIALFIKTNKVVQKADIEIDDEILSAIKVSGTSPKKELSQSQYISQEMRPYIECMLINFEEKA